MKTASAASILALLSFGAFAFASAACGESPPPPPAIPAPVSTQAAAIVSAPPVTPPPAPEPPPAPKALEPVVRFANVGLATPESVLHDEVDDVYLVSNIEGKPTEADGKAFISRLSPDGKVIELKWIEGGKKQVQLNAPKGLAIVGDLLYVADLDKVRTFDRKTGAPKTTIAIKGATFLNDIAPVPGGGVFVTDSGLKIGKAGFEPTGTDAVYRIDAKGVVKTLVKNAPEKVVKGRAGQPDVATAQVDLRRPNGLLVFGTMVLVAPFGSADIYAVDPTSGMRSPYGTAPKGQLDGLAAARNDLLVSSWESSSIYRVENGMAPSGTVTFKEIITNVASPADISVDAKRNRVLVPLFTKDIVEVYELK